MIVPRTRAWRAALLVLVLGAGLAVLGDREYLDGVREAERERVRAQVMPFVSRLRAAIDRRVGLLNGYASFVASRRTRADLEAEFATFAHGVVASTSGVRSLQYVDDGRLARIEPLEGNEGALGMDVERSPDPVVRADHALVLASTQPLVKGPIALREGGFGIIIRLRIADRPTFPQIVGVMLDAPSLFREARIPDPASGLVLVLRRAGGGIIAGGPETATPDPDPVVVPIAFEGERWSLAAAPAAGWGRGVRDWIWSFRLTLILLVLLAALIAYAIGDGLDRLTRAKERSGSALEVAMRARGTGALMVDLVTGHATASGATSLLLGLRASREPALESQLVELVAAEDRAHVGALFEELRCGDRDEFTSEVPVTRPNGATRQLLCLSQLVRDERGAPASFVAILSDVTERREMEEGLRRAERMEAVGKLAGGVAHDFNNLLTAIGGFAELAATHLDGLDSPAAVEILSDLRQVQESTQDGARLTSQLLAFSRRAPTDAGRLDLAASLANLQPMLGRLFAHQLDVHVDVGDDLPPAHAEEGLLTQVVLTLLVRARDAVPGPERVRLRAFFVSGTSSSRPPATPSGDWLCLEVREESAHLPVRPAGRRASPWGRRAMGDGAESGGLGIAVLASGIESGGGHLILETGPNEQTIARVLLPVWREPERIATS